MKKILGVIAGLMLTVATFAQSNVTFKDASADYKKASVSEFHFAFASAITLDEINKAAVFYTDYFTVTPVASATGHDVTIKLVEDTEMNRRIVMRFFVTMSISSISVNGTDMSLQDFVNEYIML